MKDDLLDRLLDVAAREKPLKTEDVRAFGPALRERARLILEERVRPLEERLAALEKENAWRREAMEGLEKENAWMRREQIGSLKNEIDALRSEGQTASAAHDRLLAHHRAVLGRVVEALREASAALPWGFRRARELLAELAAALGREIG